MSRILFINGSYNSQFSPRARSPAKSCGYKKKRHVRAGRAWEACRFQQETKVASQRPPMARRQGRPLWHSQPRLLRQHLFRRRRLRAMDVGGYTELQSLVNCGGTTNSQRNADGSTCRGRRLTVMGIGDYTELQSLVNCGGTTKSQTKSDGPLKSPRRQASEAIAPAFCY